MVLFDDNPPSQMLINKFRFHGTCKDCGEHVWSFYTDSECEFINFKDTKQFSYKMRFISGRENKDWELIRKLGDKQIENPDLFFERLDINHKGI